MSNEETNKWQGPQTDHEKAEMNLLRDGLKRTHEQRFLFLMKLVKIQATLQRATITHKTFPK